MSDSGESYDMFTGIRGWTLSPKPKRKASEMSSSHSNDAISMSPDDEDTAPPTRPSNSRSMVPQLPPKSEGEDGLEITGFSIAPLKPSPSSHVSARNIAWIMSVGGGEASILNIVMARVAVLMFVTWWTRNQNTIITLFPAINEPLRDDIEVDPELRLLLGKGESMYQFLTHRYDSEDGLEEPRSAIRTLKEYLGLDKKPGNWDNNVAWMAMLLADKRPLAAQDDAFASNGYARWIVTMSHAFAAIYTITQRTFDSEVSTTSSKRKQIRSYLDTFDTLQRFFRTVLSRCADHYASATNSPTGWIDWAPTRTRLEREGTPREDIRKPFATHFIEWLRVKQMRLKTPE